MSFGFFSSLPEGWQVTLASSAVAFAVPLLLAAIGECIVERAGVLNIGVEGMMLAGALAAVLGSYATHSPWLGLLAAIGVTLLMGAAFAALTVYRNTDQVVTGTALNLFALGLTGAVYFAVTQRLTAAGTPRLVGAKLPDWPIPGLASLPALGATLFSGNVLVYLAFLAVPVSAFFLGRTRPGLQLRAVGEYPQAAEATGTRVRRTRTTAVLFGAALAGLAGAFLSIGHVVTFAENMTAGKGFIALALVIYGRWNPWGVLAGTGVFSLAWGLAAVLGSEGRGKPEEVFLLALPYLATVVALVLRPGRTTSPAALGQVYLSG